MALKGEINGLTMEVDLSEVERLTLSFDHNIR